MNDLQGDYELVRKFLSGDEKAFNLLASRYLKKIYWHARRMVGNHDDADEIVQQVLLTIYRKLKTFNFKSSLFTWIYKITSTRSLNLLKSRKVKKVLSIETSRTADNPAAIDILTQVEEKEKFDRMQDWLKLLPVKQREIFILRNFDNLSYEEISQITGRNIGTLKANYFHAFRKMKELMEKYDR